MDKGLVVNKDKEGGSEGGGGWFSSGKKYAPALVVVVLIVIIASVVYCKDGFASPDGIVARRSQRQIRNDANFDKTFNLKELEKSVALLNRKASV